MFFFRLLGVLATALCFSIHSRALEVSSGAVRLVRNGQPGKFTSGIVQVYVTDSWGNICDNRFRRAEADVICHQLGYARTSSNNPFTNVGKNNSFGVDNSPTVVHSVECNTSRHLTLGQCEFEIERIPNRCNNTRDVIVDCTPRRISSKTYGNIRLVGGATTNVGILQVYCDGWGTVCDGDFSYVQGAVACKQLGYNGLNNVSIVDDEDDFDRLSPTVPIWLQLFPQGSCSFNDDNCLVNCALCPNPRRSVQGCTHNQDIIINCEISISNPNVETNVRTEDECSELNPDQDSVIMVRGSPTSNGGNTATPISSLPAIPSPDDIISGTIIGAIAGGVAAFFIILVLGVAVLVFIVIFNKRRTTTPAGTDNTVVVMKDLDHDDNSDKMETHQNEYIRPPFLDKPKEETASVSDILLPSLIEKENLKLIEKVGQGEFGVVYRGLLTVYEKNEAEVQSVAVKTLKGKYSQTQTDELIVEAEKMIQFNHLNVLSLTGVCLNLLESPCLVMPYMSNGSLLSYLRKESADLVVSELADKNLLKDTVKHLLSMCLQVANGMAYLTEQKFVHRDLAARNCMISADAIIKVADFGLAEDVYTAEYFKQERSSDDSVKLPLKWMALESIHYGKFSEKTDVWSYGILCWEVFSAGKSPYPGMSPREVVEMLDSGERLSKPLNPACTDEIYKLMLSCWDKSFDKRPHFSNIVISAEKILAPLADYVEFTDAFARTMSVSR